MLNGIIDFARGNLLTGWARGSDETPLSFLVHIDGTTVPASGSSPVQEPALVKFRITLPRAITAGELVDGSVKVEAVQGDERFVLRLWKPIQVAAMFDEMDENMIDRVMSCLQASTQGRLKDATMRKYKEAEALRIPDTELSASAMSELARWS